MYTVLHILLLLIRPSAATVEVIRTSRATSDSCVLSVWFAENSCVLLWRALPNENLLLMPGDLGPNHDFMHGFRRKKPIAGRRIWLYH